MSFNLVPSTVVVLVGFCGIGAVPYLVRRAIDGEVSCGGQAVIEPPWCREYPCSQGAVASATDVFPAVLR